VKFGHVVLEICEWTDRQTDRYADHSTSHACRGELMVLNEKKINCFLTMLDAI